VEAADEMGRQIALHAIGGLRSSHCHRRVGASGNSEWHEGSTHRIEHLEYVDKADVGRLAPLGITASMQPVHVKPVDYG
jgi:predicted amidohydrolase YtcJ